MLLRKCFISSFIADPLP